MTTVTPGPLLDVDVFFTPMVVDAIGAVDWRAQVAALAGMAGVQYQEAIIELLGSAHSPVEWREAIVEHLGTGYAAVDWKQSVLDAYPGMIWERAIVYVMSNL
jgi:hypothetical protein